MSLSQWKSVSERNVALSPNCDWKTEKFIIFRSKSGSLGRKNTCIEVGIVRSIRYEKGKG
jgi:hypothetical protein